MHVACVRLLLHVHNPAHRWVEQLLCACGSRHVGWRVFALVRVVPLLQAALAGDVGCHCTAGEALLCGCWMYGMQLGARYSHLGAPRVLIVNGATAKNAHGATVVCKGLQERELLI